MTKIVEMNRENGHPPPLIRKVGGYTIFIKPPRATTRLKTASPKLKSAMELEAQASPTLTSPPGKLVSSVLGSISNVVTKIQHDGDEMGQRFK